MNSLTLSKITSQICILSREGVCLLDLKQVTEKARAKGLLTLAEVAEREQKDSTNGKYYQALKSLGLFA